MPIIEMYNHEHGNYRNIDYLDDNHRRIMPSELDHKVIKSNGRTEILENDKPLRFIALAVLLRTLIWNKVL